MCGIGTTLVEAVHHGRDAVGVEYEPHWAALARDGISHAVDAGASGHAAVATGDACHVSVPGGWPGCIAYGNASWRVEIDDDWKEGGAARARRRARQR